MNEKTDATKASYIDLPQGNGHVHHRCGKIEDHHEPYIYIYIMYDRSLRMSFLLVGYNGPKTEKHPIYYIEHLGCLRYKLLETWLITVSFISFLLLYYIEHFKMKHNIILIPFISIYYIYNLVILFVEHLVFKMKHLLRHRVLCTAFWSVCIWCRCTYPRSWCLLSPWS